MSNIYQLDREALLDLLRRTDRLGVVSIYVDDDPSSSPGASAIDIKNRYRELRRHLEESEREEDQEASRALERLTPQIEALTGPREPGRGRIAFAGLGEDWFVRLDSHMPVPSRVVLDDTPFVHPLLELLDEGRPAGVVLFSADTSHLMEWQLGTLQPISELEPQEIEAGHERAGQLGGGPPGQFNSPVREHRQAREEHQAERFLDRVADAIGRIVQERGWEQILISGGDQWTEPLASRLPESVAGSIIREPTALTGLDHAELVTAVTGRLARENVAREQRLVGDVQGAGLSGTGALGLDAVTAALNKGRVSRLVYDPEVRYTGFVGAGGELYAHAGSEAEAQERTPEPRLTERLVEQAFATGARVSPVEGAAAGALGEAGGIGALLRW